MNSTVIKSVVEKKTEVSNDKTQNQVEITFETTNQNITENKTITLTGNGSVKVLIPV